MQNGDLYSGKVLSLNSQTLVLRNENLGTISLPRVKVALITLGSNAPAYPAQIGSAARTNAISSLTGGPVASTNSNSSLEAGLRQLRTNTNLIQQVQSQLLAGAGPEANAKFSELLDGLSTGKITLGDLRAQAQSAADQLRAFQRDAGDDSADLLNGYLAILDEFLRSTASASVPAPATNTLVRRPMP
jgi:hypothetical protein